MSKLGKTGEFPEGKISDDDEGGIRIGIAADRDANVVRIDLGDPVAWLAWPPDPARQFAIAILRKAAELDGKITTITTR